MVQAPALPRGADQLERLSERDRPAALAVKVYLLARRLSGRPEHGRAAPVAFRNETGSGCVHRLGEDWRSG
jgi:hypothetical protein